MREATENLKGALATGSFQFWYVADLWYDGLRRLENVPLSLDTLTDDDSRAVKAQAGGTVTWIDAYGESILPVTPGDLFSPFGSELALYAIVSVGGVETRIPMGWFQITDVPSMRDETQFWDGRNIVTGSSIELVLMDRLVQVQRDDFDVPSAPTNLVSVWSEIGRITGLKLVRSITDAPISRSVPYKEDRLQAVMDLADIIGGVPYMDSYGSLTMRPKAWPAAVDTMRRGDDGSIVQIKRGMSPEEVYNTVVFRGKSGDATSVWATSRVEEGPLRARNGDGSRSPAHRRPTFRASEFITTDFDAQFYTRSELARVANLRSVKWPIIETWNPLREVGDVVNVVDEHDVSVLCRIVSISRSNAATQEVVVIREDA